MYAHLLRARIIHEKEVLRNLKFLCKLPSAAALDAVPFLLLFMLEEFLA